MDKNELLDIITACRSLGFAAEVHAAGAHREADIEGARRSAKAAEDLCRGVHDLLQRIPVDEIADMRGGFTTKEA